MPTIEVQLRRVSVVSSRPFEEIVELTATWSSRYERVPQSGCRSNTCDLEAWSGAIGSSDLMEFVRFDAGEVLRKDKRARPELSSRHMSSTEEVHMRTTRMAVVAAVIVASGLVLHVARAQQAGTKRIDLQRHDLSVPGREVVQTIVELDPG